MALPTDTIIRIGELMIHNFNHLEIIQKIHDHNTFTLEIAQELLETKFNSAMPAAENLMGQRINIEIKPIANFDDPMILANPKDYIMQFCGIVQGVRLKKSTIDNMEETIVITGHSMSKKLDNGPDSNSFTKATLADIVNKIKSGYDIDMHIRPFHKDILAYTVQYNESDLDFLNRLAMRHGQWLYDTGKMIVFGSPGGFGSITTLVYGINMQDFSYKMILMPTLFKTIENDNRTGKNSVDHTAEYRKEANGSHQNFIDKSNQFYNKETLIPLNQNAVGGYGRSASEEYTKNKMRAIAGKLMEVKATTEVPGITLGNDVKINGVDSQHEAYYRVTEIIHICDDSGGYKNHFTAVNLNGAVFSPQTNPDLIPICSSQSAIVTANYDADGLSAVQVQMSWQKLKGVTTPYIPMLQHYGGDARGSHILPEIGDTVFVHFQGGNAEMPIVTGTLTNINEKSGYATPDNDIKATRTRSGIENLSNDAEGSWKQSTPDGNFLLFDGKGNAVLNIPKDLKINVGQHLNINVGNNMTFDVGDIAKFNIFKEMLVTTPHLQQLIADYFFTQAGKTLISSEKQIKIEAKETHVAGSQKLLMHSDENTIVNSKGIVNLHGKKGNNQTNKPLRYRQVPIYMDSRCMVKFRPHFNWAGEYGFDWMRIGDTSLDGDAKANTYRNTSKNYNALKNAYQQRTFTRKDSRGRTYTVLYFVPWLTLYPLDEMPKGFTHTKATLDLTVDIEVEPLRLELDYDKNLFTLNKDLITPVSKGIHHLQLTITCKKSFDKDKDIKVISVFKNAKGIEERALAGKIMVSANKQHYKVNCVIVRVHTNINGNVFESKPPIGRENVFANYLRQALVNPIFLSELVIDCRYDIDPKTKIVTNLKTRFNKAANVTGGKIPDGSIDAIQDFLNNLIKKTFGSKYDNVYKFHFINQEAGTSDHPNTGLYGRSYGIPSTQRSVVVYKGDALDTAFSDSTLVHEGLHAMGLYHSFDGSGQYSYSKNKTDNVMDYSDVAFTPIQVIQLWHWQHKYIYPNITKI